MMFSLAGFLAPWIVYALITLLHVALPGRWVNGYVRDPATGAPLRYRLNGLRVFFVTVLLWGIACSYQVIPWDFFYVHRHSSLLGACAAGLFFTFATVLPAKPTGRSLIADLFFGRLENPQLWGGRVDAKMWLYLVGATMLELNLLSFAAHHRIAHASDPSPNVTLYVALFTFFLAEYLFFEEVHLYTYDFFAERVGFKLGWGCLTFYPYFYGVGLWSVAARANPHRSTAWLVLVALLFFAGWGLARGANMQKFTFKTRPHDRFLGIFTPETITDGTHTLLCSGFWRVSRHVNYLGELTMASALALALGWPADPLPWLYPLYYVALLVPRERDDDRRCAAKYGSLWDTYRARVPYRIIPFVY